MFRAFAIAVLIVSFVASSPATANDKLRGKWVNLDSDTRAIPSLEIRETDDGWTFQPWYSQGGGPVEGEKVRLNLVADSVEDTRPEFGIATEDAPHAVTHYMFRTDKAQLIVEKWTVFKPGAESSVRADGTRVKRSNFRNVMKFKRAK